jgi:hypothetical protein
MTYLAHQLISVCYAEGVESFSPGLLAKRASLENN